MKTVAYAVAIIRETRFGPEIREYLERIDETLKPWSGRFRIHGGPYETVEGTWTGDLVLIEFPDLERARQWYHSPAYQAIKPLRTANTSGTVFLVSAVPDHHLATDILHPGPIG
jgi:uncharacterized protein (DUF1330 family)